MPRKTKTVTSVVGADLIEEACLRHPRAAVEVRAEDVAPEREDQDHDEGQDREDLGDRDDLVDEGCLLHPPKDHEMKEPDADRSDDDRRDRLAVPEDRKERAEGRLDQDPVGDVTDAAPDPVPERRQESGVVTEAGLGVGVDAGIEVGFALSEGLEIPREGVHPARCDAPGDNRAEGSGRNAEGSRQREDARPHHAPNHHRGEGEESQFLLR